MVWRFLVLGFSMGAVACTTVLVDPPVVYDRPDAAVITGDPSIEVGLFKEQFFTPLAATEPMPIVAGFQGGTWVMPALRAVALQGRVTVIATVTIKETGEQVGHLKDSSVRLQPTILGYAELTALPIPIIHAAPNAMRDIDDLFGESAILDMMIMDQNGRSAVAQLEITLVED
jgi:hypothetical protein